MASSDDRSPVLGAATVASLNPPPRPLLDRDMNGATCIIVMGVSGTGKSTLGLALSKAFYLPFIDGDNLHPAANIAKMSRGEPLDDADRLPWLDAIRNTAIARVVDQLAVDPGSRLEDADDERRRRRRRPGVIVACSSLTKAYRAVLRGQGPLPSLEAQNWTHEPRSGSTSDTLSLPTYFVYLKGDRDVLATRMQNRRGHFMKAGMLESQLDTLESPEGEPGVVTVSVGMSTEEQVERVAETFDSLRRGLDDHRRI